MSLAISDLLMRHFGWFLALCRTMLRSDFFRICPNCSSATDGARASTCAKTRAAGGRAELSSCIDVRKPDNASSGSVRRARRACTKI